MSQTDAVISEGSDATASVAVKVALICSATAFALDLSDRFGALPFRIGPISEAVFRVALVLAAVRFVTKKGNVSGLADSAGLSTIFFYGTSVIFTYAAKIVTIVFELFSLRGNASDAMAFVVGVPDFSTVSLVNTAIFAAFPYLAYYFAVRRAVSR
jgi:hypothetical protein